MASSGQEGPYTNVGDGWPPAGEVGIDLPDGSDELPQPIYLSRRALQSQIANLGLAEFGLHEESDDEGDEDGDDNYELIAPPLES